MNSSASKIQLTGYDALFRTSEPVEVNGNLVQEVPLLELFPFKIILSRYGMMKQLSS